MTQQNRGPSTPILVIELSSRFCLYRCHCDALSISSVVDQLQEICGEANVRATVRLGSVLLPFVVSFYTLVWSQHCYDPILACAERQQPPYLCFPRCSSVVLH
jgi:hypothetical protein